MSQKSQIAARQRWLRLSQITGVHSSCAGMASQPAVVKPLLRLQPLRRELVALALRRKLIPVVAIKDQYLCIGLFHIYGAAKKHFRGDEKVKVEMYEDITDEDIREICLSYVADELLCYKASPSKYVGALWKILFSEYRSILFPGIKSRRSLARAMNVSYATVFPTERKNESDVDGEMQGDLDLGIGDNSKTGEQT